MFSSNFINFRRKLRRKLMLAKAYFLLLLCRLIKLSQSCSKLSKQETAQAKEQLARVENRWEHIFTFQVILSQIWIVLIRHKDIKRLEEGITEIHSMFMDLAILVEQQGEMVTRIEDHINSEQIILTLPTFSPLCLLWTTANNSDFIKPGSRGNLFSCCYWCGKGTR